MYSVIKGSSFMVKKKSCSCCVCPKSLHRIKLNLIFDFLFFLNQDTEGLKVGVANLITQWVKGPADGSRHSLCRAAVSCKHSLLK